MGGEKRESGASVEHVLEHAPPEGLGELVPVRDDLGQVQRTALRISAITRRLPWDRSRSLTPRPRIIRSGPTRATPSCPCDEPRPKQASPTRVEESIRLAGSRVRSTRRRLPVTDWALITLDYLEDVWARWTRALRDKDPSEPSPFARWRTRRRRRRHGATRRRRRRHGARIDTAWPPRLPGVDLRRLYPPFWLAEILDDIIYDTV